MVNDRVMACSQMACDNPATWKMGTWWACDDHIKTMLFLPEWFDTGRGHTYFGSAYRLDDYAEPWPNMTPDWIERVTVPRPDTPFAGGKT